jgi:DNA polymerase III gamma/tau subunit
VKFILCTTEPHKVPATIQSRCQRFDFRVIPTVKIAQHLRFILEQEGVEADDQVITQIARLGHGSMRDALSLLDRLLAAGDAALTPQLLDQMLGLPDQTIAGDLVDAIAEGNAARALEAGAALLASGTGIEQSLEILIEYLRNLMLIDACGADSELVELASDARDEAAGRASQFDSAGLAHMIAVCDSVAHRARGSAAARALFDAAIVRLCLSERFADIASLLAGTPPVERKKKDQVNPSPPRAAEPPATPDVTPDKMAEPQLAKSLPLDDGEELWTTVHSLATGSANEHALIEHLAYRAFDGTTLTLSIQTTDTGLSAWLTDQTQAVVDLVRRATSHRVEVVLVASETEVAIDVARQRRDAARQLPLVRTVMEIFDADVVDVQDAGSPTDVE